MNELPIACSLTETELRERRSEVLGKAARAIVEVQEQEDGYAYRFRPDDEALEQLFRLVSLERKCCQFLRFRVTAEPGEGPLWLEVTGPSGAKEFISALFNENTWNQ